MAHIESGKEGEYGKYKLIDDSGNVVKVFTEEDEPVDFNKEIEAYNQSKAPTQEDRLTAVEMAILALMG